MTELPLGLRVAMESGNCVLFLGAGAGFHAFDGDGRRSPTGGELAAELADAFKIEGESAPDLPKIAQIVELRHGRTELEEYLRKRLANLEPDEHLRWIFSIPWRAIYTTNFDRVIQRCYESIQDPPQEPVTMSASADLKPVAPPYQVPVYHLHGALFEDQTAPVIITESDYARFRPRRAMLFESLKERIATFPILYLGYSHEDSNWKMVFSELKAEFAPSPLPSSFRVAPDTNPLDKEILAAEGIQTLDIDLRGFVELAKPAVGDVRVDEQRRSEMERSVPSDLRDLFQQSPPAVGRLLNSWMYVNQEDFTAPPNIAKYLLGDLPTWSLVAEGHPFERDIETPLTDALIDFATDPSAKPQVLLLAGSAGYGITTVLMRLAAHLVSERAGAVFFLRRGNPLLQADVEFAVSRIDGPVFFVVDNAAEAARELGNTVQRLRQLGRPACFLMGERVNEWLQRRPRLAIEQFELEPLSDEEIDRLLAFLEVNDALGVLADLPYDLQASAIRQRHSKQLLVAMREATEGRDFDVILEDEYRGIEDEFARRVYAVVCGFYRLRALARDQVVAKIAGCSVQELYERTAESTEGVVIWDCIDEANGVYAARTRHHVIADVVWNRVVTPLEQDEITRASLTALNLNYQADVRAFGHFIRNDDAVESIQSFDGKVKYFETAAQKDPRSPYVRQHYARMLRRAGFPDLALDQVEKALTMAPDLLVLLHTKGIILSDLALDAQSDEIGRRRFGQSEATFKQALGVYRRDTYAYESLARLYFEWAKRMGGDEAAHYIARAEEVITEGLREVTDRERLFVISAEIQRWLGDTPGAVERLEAAVRSTPGGTYAPYLLARAYRKQGRAEDAHQLLGPVVAQNPDEFRVVVEYALALHDLDRPYAEIIAVLRLGTTYGMRDSRFAATLGGFLFLERDFSSADAIFKETSRRISSYRERHRIEFLPHPPGMPGTEWRIEGIVVSVRPGYAFISVAGYPSIFIPGAKFGDVVVELNKRISFQLAFSARGPVAHRPTEPEGDEHQA